MQEYLKPENLGEKTGVCPVCSINLYGTKVTKIGVNTVVGEPIVMPCNVRGQELLEGQEIRKSTDRDPARYNCPFEDGKEVSDKLDITLRLSGGNESGGII